MKILDADAFDTIHSATIREQTAELDRLHAENERLSLDLEHSTNIEQECDRLRAENAALKVALNGIGKVFIGVRGILSKTGKGK